jgi:hypothetical protein
MGWSTLDDKPKRIPKSFLYANVLPEKDFILYHSVLLGRKTIFLSINNDFFKHSCDDLSIGLKAFRN